MDQLVNPSLLPGAYTPEHSKMEANSLSTNSDDKKYLPGAAGHKEINCGNMGLSSRCISEVMTEKDKDNHYIDLAKNIVLTVDPTLHDSIDEDSWKNMADSLQFSGIDSLEKATAMDLKVCPPCPVFHTWVALHGTTIFNGLNNPEKYQGMNYVQRILEEGTELSKNDIPLLIVFSDMKLRESQIDQMKGEFKKHDNILCVSLETDLQLEFPIELKEYASSMDVRFLDSIRIVVSQNITKTISFCMDKAKSENKPQLADRLEKLGVNHLFYSDIDNQWLSKPPYILARHGMFTLPIMAKKLPLITFHCGDWFVEELSDYDRERLKAHRSFFSDFPYLNKNNSKKWSKEKARKLFDYILSGKAKLNYQYLSKQIVKISSDYHSLLKPDDEVVSWEGDNGCFFVTEHSKDAFLRAASKRIQEINLHQKPNTKCCHNPDPSYYREAHSLVGMQLLKHYYYGKDYTWDV
ncbi:hypothetical protein [Salinisphaera sp. G21_0]|uniref:hypothetical protein n=1 Tax=Salinisphaera sp. G21_0 TaxID=2821094 RepID=UPI001ADBC103|nr:hypothetical protein [Salinisphaera sp. G21_0]MBO9482676.1 hypothetical protein [Salinisphaera sp. G21_0]